MSAQLAFDYKSARATRARFGAKLSAPLRAGLVIAALLCMLGGVGLLLIDRSIGLVLFSFAALPIALYIWWHDELRDVPIAKNPVAITDRIESSLLAHLPPQPTPADIATAVMRVNGGQFFAVRFGIGPSFLQHITLKDDSQTELLWRTAEELRIQIGTQTISAAILVVALVKTYPQVEGLLAHLQLDEADLMSGARWYHHIQELVNGRSSPKRTGGIARDWSFGYIPSLKQFGVNISEQIARGGLLSVELEAHQQVLDQLMQTFGSGGRQNVTLIGVAGVGKTTIVHALAEKLLDARAHVPAKLKFNQIIMLDASAIVSATRGRGEIEQLINQLLIESYKAKNIILCLDNAQLFFEEAIGSVDISNLLLPVLEGGGIRMILTMDEQRFLQISARSPGLANVLNRVVVPPAGKAETLLVMQDQLIMTEFTQHVTYMYQALSEAYRLSERYVHELAMPGRALKLLTSAASYSESGLVTAGSVQQAIEKTLNIKVGVASSGGEERETLLNMETLIHKRMINQTRAVQVVSDALRRARSGVRNVNRPIGSFLFLGPTGVGKTELAKALAEVYFGGEGSMIRIDLNEFNQPSDLQRLIADGADDPLSLTAQAMKQPFSVVLFDEIEKAHPSVIASLLQLLDEGILRDIKNREISFRDAIIIATSNAGADRIREHIGKGEALEHFEAQFVNELIDSKQFRPEFLNRFDEIVLFRPLGKDELLQVIDLILASINKNLAQQKVSVVVDTEAKAWLVEQGYDPRLGARPLRRVVQRTVENLVAKKMLEGSVAAGSTIKISLADIKAAPSQQATS